MDYCTVLMILLIIPRFACPESGTSFTVSTPSNILEQADQYLPYSLHILEIILKRYAPSSVQNPITECT